MYGWTGSTSSSARERAILELGRSDERRRLGPAASVPAAAWIAARIRGYVPQRHRFPLIHVSIFASSGAGSDSSSDTAASVCPGWQ